MPSVCLRSGVGWTVVQGWGSGGDTVANELVAQHRVESYIRLVRGQRVILDEDIAALYEVQTAQLVRAVLRNVERFPDDFMFQLAYGLMLNAYSGYR